MTSSKSIISPEAKWVTGAQAIKSPRWPFKNDKFYKMIRAGLITPIRPYEGARPVYSVAEIDTLFTPAKHAKERPKNKGR